MEQWKQFEDTKYYISDYGRVKSYHKNKETIMKPYLNKNGYHIINISGRGKMFVHRLVAICFLNKIEGKNFVNHKNFVKTDNCLQNLEWCDARENNEHAQSNGVGSVRKPFYVIDLQNNILGKFETQSLARNKFGYKKKYIFIKEEDFTDDHRLMLIENTSLSRKKVGIQTFDRFTEEQILFIRDIFSHGKYSKKTLARIFKIDVQTVSNIINRKTYTHY